MNELPERVVPGAGNYRCSPAEARRGDGYVGRATPEELPERLDLFQRYARLQGVHVDDDPSEGEDFESRLLLHIGQPARYRDQLLR